MSETRGKAIVIGGGAAGLQASIAMAVSGIDVTILERDAELGGRLRAGHRMFPDLEPPARYLDVLLAKVESNPRIRVVTGARAVRANGGGRFVVEAQVQGQGAVTFEGDVVVLATGMIPFDAREIPEFGLGKYEDVVSSELFESMLDSGGTPRRPSDGSEAKTIVFIQCVGSRVEKRGVSYCSAVCCTNSIKQAIIAKEASPGLMAYVLYIDIRTPGRGCERLYKRARQEGVLFVRGQPSVVSRKQGSDKLYVCGENTLAKDLYEIPADLVVLGVGMRLGETTRWLLADLGAELDNEGLPRIGSGATGTATTVPGLFVAGCAESPKDVHEAIAQGAEAAVAVEEYLRTKGQWKSDDGNGGR